jgi:hypothetical protein
MKEVFPFLFLLDNIIIYKKDERNNLFHPCKSFDLWGYMCTFGA